MRTSFKLAASSAAILLGMVLGMARPSQADLAGDCKPFFAAASKPPMAMAMKMPGMVMLDSSSGPLPLVCLTANDPPKPPLFEKIGTVSIKASDNKDVQAYFDQGLRFYIGFNNRESYRAFRYAAQLAAEKRLNCAWCDWGAAVPLGTDINMTNELELDRVAANLWLASARRQKPAGLLAEMIEATAKRSQTCRHDEKVEHCRDRRNREYYDAMHKIMFANPGDPTIGVFFVDSILNLTPWRLPAKDKFELARDTLERLMKSYPSHNGVIHWYIHLMELSSDPGRAYDRARTLAALAPNAGHLVHMPSHIYYRIGDMRSAIEANVDASAADEKYFSDPNNQLDHPDGDRYRFGYYPHTLHFLAAAATLYGDRKWLENAAERIFKAPPPDPQGYRADKYREVYYLARVNFAKPEAIRDFPRPAAFDKQPRANVAYAYTQVMADVWSGENPTKSLSKFAQALQAYPGLGPHPDAACRQAAATNGDTGLCMAAIEDNLVRARLAASSRQWDDALRHARAAVELQQALPYDEPPDWLYSLHQSHAAILIRRGIARGDKGDLVLARAQLRTSLDPRITRSDIFPGSGWAYYGLWQVAIHLHEGEVEAEKAFRAHWAAGGPDPSLERM
jgi:hypothetical protein